MKDMVSEEIPKSVEEEIPKDVDEECNNLEDFVDFDNFVDEDYDKEINMERQKKIISKKNYFKKLYNSKHVRIKTQEKINYLRKRILETPKIK